MAYFDAKNVQKSSQKYFDKNNPYFIHTKRIEQNVLHSPCPLCHTFEPFKQRMVFQIQITSALLSIPFAIVNSYSASRDN